MKICNKKSFLSGSVFSLMGLLLLVTGIWKGFTVKIVLLMILLFLIGGGEIHRSLSPRLSKIDLLEEQDERNRFITLQSQSRAFLICQTVCFLLMALFLVGGQPVRGADLDRHWRGNGPLSEHRHLL